MVSLKFIKFFGIALFACVLAVGYTGCKDYDGVEVSSYYSDSLPQVVTYYKYVGNKKIVVKEIRYYQNQQVAEEGNYDENNNKHGKWIYYFEDGKKKSEINYDHGKKNGEMIEYYRSGKKMYIAHYQNDIANGKWIIFDENGKKISETNYKNGVPEK
jgi:antitoxin component YwqK of YwqJK toxin-antitoxin module